ncbi:MAG: YoaK family protein [Dongiaceae bacterium]
MAAASSAAAPAAAARETRGAAATGALLAFTAGFVDTCGFIALFGLFTAHVTGNFVLIGAAIAESHQGLIGKLLALPVFVSVVAATHLFVQRRQRRNRTAARPVLVGQIVFLALFLLAGVAASPFANADAPLAIAAGMLGVAAMAIQNAASRTVFASLSPTTVMTGNVTQIVIDLVDLMGNAAAAEGTRARLGKMGAAVAAFAVGALGAGFGYVAAGFWCLAVPILAVAVVLVRQARAR